MMILNTTSFGNARQNINLTISLRSSFKPKTCDKDITKVFLKEYFSRWIYYRVGRRMRLSLKFTSWFYI